VKTTRIAAITAVAGLGVLALTACSSSSSGGTGSSGTGSANCVSGSINASGSSAQKNAMTDWINAYQTNCPGATINYTANGSGAGITDFVNNQTAFAGSDSPLKSADQAKADARCGTGNTAIDIPMVGGAIVAAYNLPGVSKLILTPKVLAGVFSSTITKWNDPAIAAVNPGVTLPSATIAQFHRSDSSGTTDNFTKYLTATAAADWTYGSNKEWKAPGGQGSKGSDGVASSVKSTPNSIGYMELSFAQNGNLSAAWIDNGAGAVEPTSANAATTLATATVTGTGNNLSLKLNYAVSQPNAYPIVLVTYQITCEKGLPASQLGLTKSFLTYTSSSDAQGMLTTTGYVPITGDLLTKVQAAVASIS